MCQRNKKGVILMDIEVKEEINVLSRIQVELKAPKNQYNKFGKYKYRSCEDILEGLKPLLDKYNCSVVMSDEIMSVGDRFYVKATAKLLCNGQNIMSASGFAREGEKQAGMSEGQLTGATSTYARKYALNGLFAIDDTKDADTDEHHEQNNNYVSKVEQKFEGEKVNNPTDEVRFILGNWEMPENDRQSYRNDLNSGARKPTAGLVKEFHSKYGSMNVKS